MIISDRGQLKEVITSAKSSGRSVLIKKGVFDIIHPGHIFAMTKFKECADIIIILVQSDEFTKKKKSADRPINNQQQRAMVMDGLKNVDYVYLDQSNSREDYMELLTFLEPTIVAVSSIDPQKTATYSRGVWELKEFPDKNKPGFSTSDIISRIKST